VASNEWSELVRITRLAAVAALCAGASALAGCGGSSSSSTTTHAIAQHPQQTAGASKLDTGAGAGSADAPRASSVRTPQTLAEGMKHAQAGTVSRGKSTQRGHSTPALSGDDHNPRSSAGANPCRLVSLPEARTITGGAITGRVIAPLGPTCVYKASRSRTNITLAVESASVSQAMTRMSKRAQLTVRGRRAVCGRLGTQMLFVPLAHGQVLHVTAPCSIAQRFAVLALDRLAA
jgi:hypothetical protein